MMISQKVHDELVRCLGKDSVLTQPGDLLTYSYDSGIDRGRPSAVVIPHRADQISKVVQILVKNRVPYVARGAATSLSGGPIPLKHAVVIALARLRKIVSLNEDRQTVCVEPGVVNLTLQEHLAAHHLFFAPDPGSQKACTIGGNVSTNAGGPHCLKYGVTSQSVVGMDWVLPQGERIRVRSDDPGYDLTGFFVGSEGTLGIMTSVELKLLKKPAHVKTMLVSFSSMEEAIQAVTDIIAAKILPATLEAMDHQVVEAVEAFVHAGYPLEAAAVLLIEVDGLNAGELENQSGKIKEICEKNGSFDFRVAKDATERQKLWEGRRGSYASMARLAPNVLVEDGAVPRTMLPEVLRRIKAIADEHGLQVPMLFHAGDGNLHPQIIFDERDREETKNVKSAGRKMLKACVELGGTISGEHGIGIDKREAMKWLFSRETLSLFRRLKNTFDPDNLCNPDKLIPLVSNVAKTGTEEEEKGPPDIHPLGQESPSTEDELLALVRSFAKGHRQFGVQGTGSKYPVTENIVVRMSKLDQIVDFDKGNLSMTVQAGALAGHIRAEAEREGQYLWLAGEGSIGGLVAAKSSVEPAVGDIILGMRVLLATGEVVKFGAKTMKNVAGYDASKLLVGSWGTLGIILDVTFRLFPTPAPALKVQKAVPFVLRDIHKKIKKAFDPHELLSQKTVFLTADQIGKLPVPDSPLDPNLVDPERINKKVGDSFWSQ